MRGEIRVCRGALSRIKTEESNRLWDNSINANYREIAGCYRVEQSRQIGGRVSGGEGGRLVSRELGDAGTTTRQAINDDMIDISKYFPRDTSSRDRLHLPSSLPLFPSLRYFAIGVGYRQRHLFKCNISPLNEDYLLGKCVPQVHILLSLTYSSFWLDLVVTPTRSPSACMSA